MVRYQKPYKIRWGWGAWRWVHVRFCHVCQRTHKILGNFTTMRGTPVRPSLPPGGFYCDCGEIVRL